MLASVGIVVAVVVVRAPDRRRRAALVAHAAGGYRLLIEAAVTAHDVEGHRVHRTRVTGHEDIDDVDAIAAAALGVHLTLDVHHGDRIDLVAILGSSDGSRG